MSIDAVTVVITCNGCSKYQEVEMENFTTDGGVNIEQTNQEMIEQGWRVNGEEHFCPDCPEPPDNAQDLCPCQDNDNPHDSDNGRCEPCNRQMSDRCADDCVHGCGGTGYLPLPETAATNTEDQDARTPG